MRLPTLQVVGEFLDLLAHFVGRADDDVAVLSTRSVIFVWQQLELSDLAAASLTWLCRPRRAL